MASFPVEFGIKNFKGLSIRSRFETGLRAATAWISFFINCCSLFGLS